MGYFLDFYCENLVEFLEVKPMNRRKLPKTENTRSIWLKLVYTQPSVIHQNYHLYVPTSLWLHSLLIKVSTSQLYLSGWTSLSRFGVVITLWPQFLMSPREIIDLQFSSIFGCKNGSEIFQDLLYFSSKIRCLPGGAVSIKVELQRFSKDNDTSIY